ncbi:hypothetical protein BHE74_00008603 [Ensete ventricosum]|nr:hypothetical protein BHE74_00008603 [Ensete ventricosum]
MAQLLLLLRLSLSLSLSFSKVVQLRSRNGSIGNGMARRKKLLEPKDAYPMAILVMRSHMLPIRVFVCVRLVGGTVGNASSLVRWSSRKATTKENAFLLLRSRARTTKNKNIFSWGGKRSATEPVEFACGGRDRKSTCRGNQVVRGPV